MALRAGEVGSLVPEIEALFQRHGEQVCDGNRREPVTATPPLGYYLALLRGVQR